MVSEVGSTNTMNNPAKMKYEGRVDEHWRVFKQRFELYIKASGNFEKDDEIKMAILLNSLEEKGITIYNQMHPVPTKGITRSIYSTLHPKDEHDV